MDAFLQNGCNSSRRRGLMNTASFPLFYHRSQINANLVELGLTCPRGKYYNINCDFMLRRRRAWPDGKADRIDLHPRRDERNSERRRTKGAVRRSGGRLKAALRGRVSFRLFRKGGKPKCRASGEAAKSAFFGSFQTRSRAIPAIFAHPACRRAPVCKRTLARIADPVP